MRVYKLLIQMDAFGSHPFLILMRAAYGAPGKWKVKGMDLANNQEYKTDIIEAEEPYKVIRAWIARQIEIQNGAILSYGEVKL